MDMSGSPAPQRPIGQLGLAGGERDDQLPVRTNVLIRKEHKQRTCRTRISLRGLGGQGRCGMRSNRYADSRNIHDIR